MVFDIYRTNRRVYLRGTILFGIPNKLPATKENKDDTMTTSLGAKIKRHRQEKGYSLDKLAELTELEQELHLGTGEPRHTKAVRRKTDPDRSGPRGHDRLSARRQRGARRRRF